MKVVLCSVGIVLLFQKPEKFHETSILSGRTQKDLMSTFCNSLQLISATIATTKTQFVVSRYFTGIHFLQLILIFIWNMYRNLLEHCFCPKNQLCTCLQSRDEFYQILFHLCNNPLIGSDWWTDPKDSSVSHCQFS